MAKEKRISSHVIDDIGSSHLKLKVNETGNLYFRELSGYDYGIDGIIELFESGLPTGKIAYVQIKSTSKEIIPLKRTPEFFSCDNVSDSNEYYLDQNNIPILYFIISIFNKDYKIYYTLLNPFKKKDYIKKKSVLNLPFKNYINSNNINVITNIIDNYYIKK